MEAHAARLLVREGRDPGRVRPPMLRGPPAEAAAVALDERREDGKLPEACAGLPDIALEGGVAAAVVLPELLERAHLEREHMRAIDQPVAIQRASESGQPLQVGAERLGAGHLLDAQVERVEK